MLEDHEPIFGKNVIETLSEGMYDNPLFLFREYVQNAADAIDSAVHKGILAKDEGQIEIWIDPEKRIITFEDNGTGISKDFVKKMLANIGDSQKDRKTDKGFRGIGRLGGLGYCHKVRFETSAKGEATKSILEWDARNLHEILADKNEHLHAGQLIKRITSTRDEQCDADEHFFKVSLVNVNKTNDDLLDVEDVRKYLSMVAPVPFDYQKFRFVKDIEDFIKSESLPDLHKYSLNLNGDEVRKGYETPLKIEDGKDVEILGVECRPLRDNGKTIGWYWFCLSRFEGVLPKKCWQRSIRLRKSNIQIGEADCLSNHPKRGQALWKEDRGNSYFIGEIHALDDNLTPNSRRDYFNQDEACREFEAVLSSEFHNLHELYHAVSKLRSGNAKIQAATAARQDFEKKDKSGSFFNAKERDAAKEKVAALQAKVQPAIQIIEKTLSKSNDTALKKVADEYTPEIIDTYDSVKKEPFKPEKHPENGYANIPSSTCKVLNKVFHILEQMLPPEQVEPIKATIIKRFSQK